MHARKVVLALALSLCVFLVGCNSAVVTVVAAAAIDDAALIATLADPNLTPAQKAALLAYAQQASVAVGQVTVILSAGGTPAQMALQITAALGSLVAPDLCPVPPIACTGTPAIVVAAVT